MTTPLPHQNTTLYKLILDLISHLKFSIPYLGLEDFAKSILFFFKISEGGVATKCSIIITWYWILLRQTGKTTRKINLKKEECRDREEASYQMGVAEVTIARQRHQRKMIFFLGFRRKDLNGFFLQIVQTINWAWAKPSNGKDWAFFCRVGNSNYLFWAFM